VLVDSHCHLQDPKFDPDRDAVIQRAQEAGVSTLVVIGYDMKASRRGVDLAESGEVVYATVGVHPHEAQAS
jgi:TatD DNase family protein